jgi:hypothetical protein
MSWPARAIAIGRPVRTKKGRGPNLFVDGDMEAAGVSAWSVVGSTTTKITALPYQGLQSMRSAKTGSGTRFWGPSGTLTPGKTYRLTGAARGHGVTSYPRVWDDAHLFLGTPSTDWQTFDVTWVANGTMITFYTQDGLVGDFTEWDDLYLSLEA